MIRQNLQSLEKPEFVMQAGQYPKVFFFRGSKKIGKSMTVKYSAWDRHFESPVLQMELPGAICHNGIFSDVLVNTGKTRGLQSEGNNQR
jgi:hypothetical protein